MSTHDCGAFGCQPWSDTHYVSETDRTLHHRPASWPSTESGDVEAQVRDLLSQHTTERTVSDHRGVTYEVPTINDTHDLVADLTTLIDSLLDTVRKEAAL